MKIGWLWRLYIYGTISVLIGPFYDNWVSMEKYLYRVGAYRNLCPDIAADAPVTDTWSCKKQQESITILLTVVRGSECSFSVLIGILMDRAGPRITAVTGVILRIIGWTLIGFTVHVNYTIVLAFVLLGLSVNFIVFPALTIGLYTRKYRFVTVVQIGMCSCFASFIIKIKVSLLESGALSAEQINYLYTILALLPCLALCIVFFPLKLKDDIRSDPPSPVHAAVTNDVPATNAVGVPDPISVAHANAADDTTVSGDISGTKAIGVSNGAAIDLVGDITPDICDKSTLKWYYDGLWHTLTTKEVVTCLVYFAYNFGSITFVQQSYSIMYRDNSLLLTLLEYLVPLAFVPCIIFSALYMCVKPLWILLFINVLGAVMHLVATLPSQGTGILLAFLLIVVYSVLNTKVYNYLDSLFDDMYMGAIVGALNTTCGVWLLLQGFILQGKSTPREFDVINYVMLSLRLLFLLPFVYLGGFAKHIGFPPDRVRAGSSHKSQVVDDMSAESLPV